MRVLHTVRSVALAAKKGNRAAEAACRQAELWLKKRGVAVFSCESPDGDGWAEDFPQSDLILAFGGDGTMVSLARHSLGRGIPVAGVNFGRVGFLAELCAENWQENLAAALSDGLRVDSRMSLRYSLLREGRVLHSGEVINDVVVTRGKVARLVNLFLEVNAAPFISLRSDGLIFSTPIGSSGYAGSAGGPLLMPGLAAYVVAAICPYLSSFPPLALSPDTLFAVTVGEAGPDVYLTLDGQEAHPMAEGDRLEVRGEPQRLLMASFGLKDYFERLRLAGFAAGFSRSASVTGKNSV